MSVKKYVGARYVPKLDGDWSPDKNYEYLTIVTYKGNSYTSKMNVPNGIQPPDINTEYWVCTGNYNQQIEDYKEKVNDITYYATPEMFGAIGDGVHDDTIAIQMAFDSEIGCGVSFANKKYAITAPLNVNVKGATQFIQFNNCELIAKKEMQSLIIITGSDKTGSTNQSILKIYGGTLNANNLASIALSDNSKLTVIDGLNILDAIEIGIKIGTFGDDIASGAQKYSNINIGRILTSNFNTGIGMDIENPDGQFSNINIARYNKGIVLKGGGCCFNNIHLTAQFPNVQSKMPECYGFYFDTPITYRNNTSIANAYFDALKYCVYFNKNTGYVAMTNSFYLLDQNLFSSDVVEAFLVGGTYGAINVNNFNICGTSSKLSFKDKFCRPSTRDIQYNNIDINRNYFYVTPDLIDGGNLKGGASVITSTHTLPSNKYKLIGCILYPVITESTNYFYPDLIDVNFENREYGYLNCQIVYDSSTNMYKIINKHQFPNSLNDARLFVQNGRNMIEIEGTKYCKSNIYLYGDGLDGLATLKMKSVNNLCRIYIRSVPKDSDIFESVDNLTEISSHS